MRNNRFTSILGKICSPALGVLLVATQQAGAVTVTNTYTGTSLNWGATYSVAPSSGNGQVDNWDASTSTSQLLNFASTGSGGLVQANFTNSSTLTLTGSTASNPLTMTSGSGASTSLNIVNSTMNVTTGLGTSTGILVGNSSQGTTSLSATNSIINVSSATGALVGNLGIYSSGITSNAQVTLNASRIVSTNGVSINMAGGSGLKGSFLMTNSSTFSSAKDITLGTVAGSLGATLTINGGSQITQTAGSNFLSLGNGSITVDGAGSSLSGSLYWTIGGAPNSIIPSLSGTLTVSNGATVQHASTTGAVNIGASGATGVVNISSGTLTSNAPMTVGGSETYNQSGTGTVNVTNGVNIVTGTLSVGRAGATGGASTGTYTTSGASTVTVGSLIVASTGSAVGNFNLGGSTVFTSTNAGRTASMTIGGSGTGTFTKSNTSVLQVDNIAVGANGALVSNGTGVGAEWQIRKNFTNVSNRNTVFDLDSATLIFMSATSHNMDVRGADLGSLPTGWVDNFALDVLKLNSTSDTISLIDTNVGTAALYINALIITGGTTSDIATLFNSGINVYYNAQDSRNAWLGGANYAFGEGGSLIAVPEPGASLLLGVAGMAFLIFGRRKKQH